VKVVEALRRRLVRERLAETGTAQQYKDRAAQHSAQRQESTLITPYEYCAKLAAATPFYSFDSSTYLIGQQLSLV
jgi:hypothetical protein